MNDTVSKTEEEDLNDFTFKGAFMSSDDGAWMASIDDLDEDASIHDNPLPPPSLIHSNSEVTEYCSSISNPVLPNPLPTNAPTSSTFSTLTNPPRNVDPFATAALRLAMSAVANEMDTEGFAVDTLLQVEEVAETLHEMEEPSDAPSLSRFGPVPPPNPDSTFQPVPIPPLIGSLDPMERTRYAFIALAAAAEPRNPSWP